MGYRNITISSSGIVPALYRLGVGMALLTGVVFTSVYAWRVAADAEKLELALATTQDKQLQEWPPTAPQFRALCENRNPEVFGLPSEEQAYREACRRAYRNGPSVTRWTAGPDSTPWLI